jgi:hypothetical protein
MIRYRHHPYSGQEVEIIRRFRRYVGDSVIVQIERSAVQLVVPVWMLDPVFCGRLRFQSEPRVSISALLELRELLDSQPSLPPSSKAVSSKRDGGGDDGQEDGFLPSAAHAGVRAP